MLWFAGRGRRSAKRFPLGDVKAIVPNVLTVCALLRNGSVVCSPNGDDISRFTAVEFDGRVKSLDASNGLSMCALVDGEDEPDRVECFETSAAGAGTPIVPSEVPGVTGAKQIAVGDGHACALVGKDVLCWGDNSAAQLGRGAGDFSDLSVQIAGLGSVQSIDAGLAHTCAHLKNGRVQCWGSAFGPDPEQITCDISGPSVVAVPHGLVSAALATERTAWHGRSLPHRRCFSTIPPAEGGAKASAQPGPRPRPVDT